MIHKRLSCAMACAEVFTWRCRSRDRPAISTPYGGGGYITLYWGSRLELPDGREVSGQYGYYQLDEQGTIGSTGGTIDHMYIQDRWRVTQRLTLDLGLRMENETVPSFRRDIKDYAF